MWAWLSSSGGQEARRKAWHALLLLASAYAATDQRFTWSVPVLTGLAGMSAPPVGVSRLGAAGVVAATALATRAAFGMYP